MRFLLRHFDGGPNGRKQHILRRSSGCGSDTRVVHLAAFPIFSRAKGETNSLTRATEEPLDSGNDAAHRVSRRAVASLDNHL